MRNLARRAAPLTAWLLVGNVAAWGWALWQFAGHPVLLGTAMLAYALGLRHAVDADHIAAIDNVTRKLMQRREQPLSVGLWFSLGHSSVVVLASAAIAATSAALRGRFAVWQTAGGLIGTGVSASFLFLIALANIVALVSIGRALKNRKVEDIALPGGLAARLLRPVMHSIDRPWHMVPLGFLFGLGFDTASEIGLLGISATQASQNLPLWSIMVFPALFTAGMALVDTADGMVMAGAYGWAFDRPLRKLVYNFTITLVSIVIALAVATLELLGLVAERFAFRGGAWDWIAGLNAHFGLIGCAIVALFIACWGVSLLLYRRFESQVAGQI